MARVRSNRSGGRRLALLAGVLVLLAVAGGWATADTPEPPEAFSQVNVTPSDGLPPNGLSKVVATNFFFEGSLPPPVVAHQCSVPDEGCGPDTTLIATANPGEYAADVPLVRYLTIRATTVDCAVIECILEVTGPAFATHHLTFSTVVPTTTTIPRATTTTATTPPPTTVATTTTRPAPTTTTTRAPQPGATIPPTTRTTLARTTTTRPPSTTTTVPPPSTTTTAPPAPPGPTLIAVTSKNEPSGPPGSSLRVQGSGYTCPIVYFFFDGTRVGTGDTDGAGNVKKGGLSVPGDTGKGQHRVTSSCEESGGAVAQAAVFQVLPVSVHRPAFVTALPLPSQVPVEPGGLLVSAAVAMGAILLIAFPYELFNSTMEENYDEIRGWFGMGPRGVPAVKTRSRTLAFFGLTAVSAAACGFLSPDFGLNLTSLVTFLGMFVALIVMAVLFSVPADIGIRRDYGEWGKLNFLPGSVIVSIVLVLASRLLHFQPGYFYGALAGLAFRSALSEDAQGKYTAANWLFSLVISVGAFFLRVPVAAAAARPGANVWWIGVEVCLALIFLWGVEGLAVAMLPMRFLDGRKVFRWSRTGWAVLFFLGIFATVQVLLRPGSGYVGESNTKVGIGVMVLFAGFGLLSVGLWAYFRFRPERWNRARA